MRVSTCQAQSLDHYTLYLKHLSLIFFKTSLYDGHYHHHFIDEETEVSKNDSPKMTSPEMAEQNSKPQSNW